MVKEDKKYIKSYTDIDQSRKLAEILPLNSADACYNDGELRFGYVAIGRQDYIPCWSLAALLEYLRSHYLFIEIMNINNGVLMDITFYGRSLSTIRAEGESIIDACYELILKLNKSKML